VLCRGMPFRPWVSCGAVAADAGVVGILWGVDAHVEEVPDVQTLSMCLWSPCRDDPGSPASLTTPGTGGRAR
jgi:hypothetical protein